MTQVQAGERVVLLNPMAEMVTGKTALAQRLPSLASTTISVINALIDLERSNGQLFSSYVGETLLRHGAHEILDIRKEATGSDLPEGTISQITSRSQGAIILQGD